MTFFRTRTFLGALGLVACAGAINCGDSTEKSKAASAAHGTTTTTTGTGTSTGEGDAGAGGGATTTPTGTAGQGPGGAGGSITTSAGGAGAGGAGTGGAGTGGAGGASTTSSGGAGGSGTGGAGGSGTTSAGGADAGAPDAGVTCMSPVFADSPPIAGTVVASAAEDKASSSYLVTPAGITRYDAAGTLVWTKKFDANASARRVLVDSGNSPIVVGVFSGSASFGATTLVSAGQKDIFVAKLDTNGNPVWATSAGGPGDDEATDLAVDDSGNVVVAGSYSLLGATFGKMQLPTAGGRDVFVVKLDGTGALVWVRSFGGPGDDYTFALGGDDSGHVVGGMYSMGPSVKIGSTTLMAGQHLEAIVYRLDPDGTPSWAKAAGGDADTWVSGIDLDQDGNAYVAGMFGGTTTFDLDHGVTLTAVSGTESFLARYDTLGSVTWAQRVGDGVLDLALQNGSAGDTVSVDPTGNATVVGWFSGAASFGPAGNGTPAKSAGGTDAFIARFDATGKLVCLIAGGGAKDDLATGVAADGIGGLVASGYFDSSAVLAGLPLSGLGGPSPFTIKLTQ